MVDEDSLTLSEFARGQIELPTAIVGGRDRIRAIPEFCKVSSADAAGVLTKIKGFCRAYTGVAVLMGGPGAGREQDNLESFRMFGVGSPFVSSSHFDCIPAANFNEMRGLRGLKDAEILKC